MACARACVSVRHRHSACPGRARLFGDDQPIYQSVNPTIQNSLLTPWQDEINNAARNNGLTDKRGVLFLASLNQANGLVAVSGIYHII